MDMKNVLMVLPKRAIGRPSEMDPKWDLDKDSSGISVFEQENLLARAVWETEDDFGFDRPAIQMTVLNQELELDLFEALVSRLALAYESMPSRYPLYIRVPKDHLMLIAKASRMGFVPYFGEWKESSSHHSQNTWEEITHALRTMYPQGAPL